MIFFSFSSTVVTVIKILNNKGDDVWQFIIPFFTYTYMKSVVFSDGDDGCAFRNEIMHLRFVT